VQRDGAQLGHIMAEVGMVELEDCMNIKGGSALGSCFLAPAATECFVSVYVRCSRNSTTIVTKCEDLSAN